MNKAGHYRMIAEQCRALAGVTPAAADRVALLEMAQRWMSLAEEREKLVREHPELFPSDADEPSEELGNLRIANGK